MYFSCWRHLPTYSAVAISAPQGTQTWKMCMNTHLFFGGCPPLFLNVYYWEPKTWKMFNTPLLLWKSICPLCCCHLPARLFGSLAPKAAHPKMGNVYDHVPLLLWMSICPLCWGHLPTWLFGLSGSDSCSSTSSSWARDGDICGKGARHRVRVTG